MKHALMISFLVLAACANRGTAEPPPPSEEAAAQQEPAAKGEETMELEGRLEPTVEAGGWVLHTEQGTYLLLSITEYRQEPWFKEGARVKVTGEESPDTITIFMQGTPFQVESMEPIE